MVQKSNIKFFFLNTYKNCFHNKTMLNNEFTLFICRDPRGWVAYSLGRYVICVTSKTWFIRYSLAQKYAKMRMKTLVVSRQERKKIEYEFFNNSRVLDLFAACKSWVSDIKNYSVGENSSSISLSDFQKQQNNLNKVWCDWSGKYAFVDAGGQPTKNFYTFRALIDEINFSSKKNLQLFINAKLILLENN